MRMTDEASKRFILKNYIPVRDFYTGDIVAIKSLLDGELFTIDDNQSFFNKVAKVFEEEIINEKLELMEELKSELVTKICGGRIWVVRTVNKEEKEENKK